MATDSGVRLSKVVHRCANADLTLDGISYPCHHAAFDRGNPLYDVGHSKRRTLASHVELPAYDLKGQSYDLDQKVKTGVIVNIVSRQRKALSHRVRIGEPIAFDEAAISFTVTDLRR